MSIAVGPAKAGHYETPARAAEDESPRAIVEIDTAKLKGDPAMLAWSPDGSMLYLETVQRDRRGAVTSAKHYVITIDSKSVKSVDEPPAWASQYWAWKSAQVAPGDKASAARISVESRQETVRATAAPTGGALAKGAPDTGATGTTVDDMANAATQTQMVQVYALRFAGQLLGEWRNEAVVPGLTFGWAPAPPPRLAFAPKDGGPLTIVDDRGRRQEIAGTKSSLLPAWSDDGANLAWLERKDKKHFELMMTSPPSR